MSNRKKRKSLFFPNGIKTKSLFFSSASERNKKGADLARRFGLEKIATLIMSSGNVFVRAFQPSIDESSINAITEVLIKTSENLKLVHKLAANVFSPTKSQKIRLLDEIIEILIKTNKNPWWTLEFARNVSDITNDQITKLLEVVVASKNSGLAHEFARNVYGLTEDQRKKLNEIPGY